MTTFYGAAPPSPILFEQSFIDQFQVDQNQLYSKAFRCAAVDNVHTEFPCAYRVTTLCVHANIPDRLRAALSASVRSHKLWVISLALALAVKRT